MRVLCPNNECVLERYGTVCNIVGETRQLGTS